MTATSTASAAGPQYFVVATPLVDYPSAMSPSYIDGLLRYQVSELQAFIQEQSTKVRSNSLAPPAQQVTALAESKLVEYLGKLEPFVYLPAGWNGEGSRGPTAIGIWQAVLHSFQLIAIGLPAPQPKMLLDGTLGVYWRKGLQYASIDFESDGVHVWTITDGSDFKSGTWDAAQEIPLELRAIGPGSRSESGFGDLQAALR